MNQLNDDALIRELHEIREELWKESGQNLHAMIRLIEQEAREIMAQYRGQIPMTTSRVRKPSVPRPSKRRQRAASPA